VPLVSYRIYIALHHDGISSGMMMKPLKLDPIVVIVHSNVLILKSRFERRIFCLNNIEKYREQILSIFAILPGVMMSLEQVI
jgi:hypothetical protein